MSFGGLGGAIACHVDIARDDDKGAAVHRHLQLIKLSREVKSINESHQVLKSISDNCLCPDPILGPGHVNLGGGPDLQGTNSLPILPHNPPCGVARMENLTLMVMSVFSGNTMSHREVIDSCQYLSLRPDGVG